MKLTANFTVEEFERSATADKYKINNTIPSDLRGNALSLAQMLQKIREEYGYPIVVSSAYRCPELNRKVGGAVNSEHMFKNGSAAADIHSVSDTLKDNMTLYNCIDKMIKNKKIKCGQFIFEYGKRNVGPDWIHISIPTSRHNNEYVYIGC